MSLKTRYLNILDYSIEISSEKRILDLIEDNAGVILPDISIQDNEKFIIGSIIIKTSNGNKFKKLRKNNYILGGDYNLKQLAMDALMLSSRLLESILVEDDFYSFHSAAVSDSEHAILLAGSSSSGKTTTAVNACLNSLNKIQFYSGDRTILNELTSVAGTKKFHIRDGSIIYEIPELQKYIKLKKVDCPWDTFEIIEPKTIKICSGVGRKEIKCIIYPRKGSHRLTVGRIRDEKAVLRLHDDACHFSDTYPNIILGQKEPISIEISRKNKKKRIDYILSLSKEVPILTASGKLSDITDFVINLMLNEADYEKYLKS